MSRAGRADLRRTRSTRRERRRILVVTEGRVTEPQYFTGLAKYARATGLTVQATEIVGLGRDPSRVVREAIQRRDGDRRIATDRDRYDEVWCVFDVDQHALIAGALVAAKRESIGVAVSNPCFELWLLWHLGDLAAAATPAQMRRHLKPYGIEGKAMPASFPYHDFAEAVRRAEVSCPADPYAIPGNPGTSVGRIVTRIVNQRTG